MHAVTWRTARCARRIPAAVIAGRRYPPRLRSFHHHARLCKPVEPPNEPRDSASSSTPSTDNEKDKRPPAPAAEEDQQHGSSSPEVAAAAKGSGEEPSHAVLTEKVQRSREKIRQYNSALRRSARSRQVEDFPPIHFGDRFLRHNVTIREDRADEAEMEYKYLLDDPGFPGGRGPSKPEANGTLCLTRYNLLRPEEGTKEVARLRLPLPDMLFEMLEKTAVEGGKAVKKCEYEDVLEYVNRVYAESGRPDQDPSKPAPSSESERPSSVDRTLHFCIYLEVLAAVAGGLGTAHPEVASSFASAKSNLILHSPVDGGITRLDRLVEHVGAELEADVIKIDAQDIAELVGDYLGEGPEHLSAFSMRSLGYDTHRSKSEGFEMEEDEYDELEAEEDAEDPQDDPFASPAGRSSSVPSKGGSKKKSPPAFVLQGIQTVEAKDIFRLLSGAARGSPNRNALAPDLAPAPYGRGQSPESMRYDEMKLGAFLEALLDSPSAKRAKARKSDTVAESHAEFAGSVSPAPASSQGSDPLLVGETPRVQLRLERGRPTKAQRPPQRTVVLIKDYKELSVTQQGARVLDKITELVHNRRKDGAEIMIVGTTSSSELVPEISRSGIRGLQAENEDSYYRTIVVPLGPVSLRPSIDVQKSLSPELLERQKKDVYSDGWADFETAERRRNEDINLRHIHDMIRRLDPTAKILARDSPVAVRYPTIAPATDFRSRVLSFHEIHRLAQTAIGLHRAAAENTEELNGSLIQLAALLTRLSDDVKFSWAAQERLAQRDTKDSAAETTKPVPPTPSKTDSDHRLEKVQKTANKHEKKLLSGVVNPANIKTTFQDVHAPEETVEALKMMTSLSLQRPDAFSYGVLAADKIPGLLLYGPPGTGKTLLAKAVAKESGATVLEVSGSEVYDMYVGEGEKNVRAIFSLARKLSPCVVFIDEADAIFGSRSGSRHRTSHREVLNQFLKEWDGMNDLSVFIMVATNRPFDMDDAVLRRLPRRLLVDLPTEKDRQEILRIHLKDEQLDPDIKLDGLAAQTPFYSGSDLKNLCVAAALNCVREENEIAAAQRVKDAEAAAAAVARVAEEQVPEAATTANTDANGFFTAANANAEAEEASPSSSSSTTETPEQPTHLAHSPGKKQQSLYPAKRTLRPHHFDKAMQEISASISEDMASLAAIRKFDEQYGDKRGKRKKRSSWGFALAEDVGPQESAARVRQQ